MAMAARGELAALRRRAGEVRRMVLELASRAGEGHCASALSIAEIVAVLFFHRLRLDPARPDWAERDRFILSKGHACQALYVALHLAGFFDREKLDTFLQPHTGLAGHPVRGGAPGIEASTGSLGQGLSVAAGMALAAKIDGARHHTFVLIGDGESNEGIVWEAALGAAQFGLDNLTVVLDRNNFQCDGSSDAVLRLDPLDEKWRSFGWEPRCCDGHDVTELVAALDAVPFLAGRPSIVVARTVKGKGVSFMENSEEWHYRAPTAQELACAFAELASAGKAD